ncbi:MAG: deoxyguanosinetriphosphate triphosphohydrolase [Deltaproteobacteria bacterium]|nr:deoxyguanosinetriphosphate triphosphohydrolase [Deltaproteobacteria bacterium]
MTIRRELEERERRMLSPRAMLSSESRGRLVREKECDLRMAFQRDRDRIIHSKAFRRLKHKTQVFLIPGGDHYRTRMTHTLEVSQIARTIARALALNEDLTEAIALGHDLGHTPFGHAGEEVLNTIVPGGFRHPEQSLRVVDEIEKLNLTVEVRDGILKHSKRGGPIVPDQPSQMALTLEGQIVRVADSIAYLNHDLDDALRAKVISRSELKAEVGASLELLGASHSQRIGRMVFDVVDTTLQSGMDHISAGPAMLQAAMHLRGFLDREVYNGAEVHDDFVKASKVIRELYAYYTASPEAFAREAGKSIGDEEPHRLVCDFISGMTDRYAFKAYEKIFLPQPWLIV